MPSLHGGARDARCAADADVQADAAKIVATAAALKNADANIQLHGGIGVTDEHDAHLFLKRVHMMRAAGLAEKKFFCAA